MVRVRMGGPALCVMLMSATAIAQGQPETIPTVLARAMAIESEMFGKAQYIVGSTPSGWPATLVPPGAKIVGGGVIGDAASFHMQTAVFEIGNSGNARAVLGGLIASAGYGPPTATRVEGFALGSGPSAVDPRLCKESTLATFDVVDSSQMAVVVAIRLIDGQAGKQNCAPQSVRPAPGRLPITVPTMTPPAGAMSFAGGSSWGNSGGTTSSTLRTTLSADSILYAYTAQLVKAGWKAEGRPAIGDGISAQRFSFRDSGANWSAALVIMTAGDLRDVRLQFTKVD